ncbi:MAG: molybdopterin-dependent oxidoreductase [Acidimicrobiales bacterium]
MPEQPELTEEEYRRRARRSLLVGGVASFAGYRGWRWIQDQPEADNIPQVLRDGHELNESIWSSLFREDHQARTFSRESADILRVNGLIGIRDEIDLDSWQLDVFGPDGEQLATHTLDDIKALPRHEMTIEHKCIEGWAQITNWQGARFSDFMALHADRLPDDISDIYLETPDGDYYVTVDIETMRHDQSLLVYDNFDVPINDRNGAPLRLATPLKYGIKQIKRIGQIHFRTEQGADYWGERGYDYYAGL